MRIGLTFDLRPSVSASEQIPHDFFAERNTLENVEQLRSSLASLGHEVVSIGDPRQLVHFLERGTAVVDLVFNISEGTDGRSRKTHAPAILEVFGIPYTFSDPTTMTICQDKSIAKLLWQGAGLPTAAFEVVHDRASVAAHGALVSEDACRFVKPLYGGVSKGISDASITRTRAELEETALRLIQLYEEPVLIEDYLAGREFSVGITGTGAEAAVLGSCEVVLEGGSNKVFGSTEKAKGRTSFRRILDPALTSPLGGLALRAYRAVGCRDAGRVDIKLDARMKAMLLEINPIPGLYPTRSILPTIAAQQGLSYPDLLQTIIDSATRRTALGASH